MLTRRLNWGEFTTPEAAQASARLLFLLTVAELVPDVLATLRDDVLPVYSTVYKEVTTCAGSADAAAERLQSYEQVHRGRVILCCRPYDVSRWRVVGGAHVSKDLAWYPDLLPLREAVEAWSVRHHLHEPWVHEPALVQLATWGDYPTRAAADRLRWLVLAAGGPGSVLQPHEHRFVFEHAGWDPTWSTRTEAEKTMRADFEQRLHDYMDAVETRVAAANGFERSKQYRSLRQHMSWLVRYQVECLNFSQVGRCVYVGARAVTDEVKAAADLLGLDLRPPQRGAPPGPRAR